MCSCSIRRNPASEGIFFMGFLEFQEGICSFISWEDFRSIRLVRTFLCICFTDLSLSLSLQYQRLDEILYLQNFNEVNSSTVHSFKSNHCLLALAFCVRLFQRYLLGSKYLKEVACSKFRRNLLEGFIPRWFCKNVSLSDFFRNSL